MALTVPGVDYAWGGKPYDDFKRAGIKFAMRYISHDPGKDLTLAEKDQLFRRGINVGLVFESTAGRAKTGRSGGRQDAMYANARVKALGLDGIPIYFAVDFDATESQKPIIADYLSGAAAVIGKHRVGVYGGYHVVKYMYDKNVCEWFWQTYAWSGGLVHPKAHIYQYRNGVRIGGLSCDMNHGRDDIPFGVRGPGVVKPVNRKRSIWRKRQSADKKTAGALKTQLKKLLDRIARRNRLLK
jgi:hypothetical protein